MSQHLFDMIELLKQGCLNTERQFMSEFELTSGELAAIKVLSPGEKLPGGELARRLQLSRSRGSRLLSQLMEKGFVSVQHLPDNRRTINICLTAKGSRTRLQIDKALARCESHLLTHLPEAEREAFLEALQKLAQQLNQNSLYPFISSEVTP